MKKAIYAVAVLSMAYLLLSCGGSNPRTSLALNDNESSTSPSVIALNSITSTGSVGDVKYSILEPDKFNRANGGGWVLMDGRDITGTDLWKLTGMDKLPDARGIFLRGMNLGQDKGKGNSDGDLLVGTYQSDMVGPHHHNITPSLNVGWSVEGNGDKRRIDSDDGPSWNNTDQPMSAVQNEGKETRPRNISLYIYIKVSTPLPPTEPSPSPNPSGSNNPPANGNSNNSPNHN